MFIREAIAVLLQSFSTAKHEQMEKIEAKEINMRRLRGSAVNSK